MRAYDALIRRHSTEYGRVPRARHVWPALRSRPGAVEARFRHVQRLDPSSLRGRAWSSSYVVHGVSNAEAFDADIVGLFAAHAVNGVFAMDYETRAVAWPASAP